MPAAAIPTVATGATRAAAGRMAGKSLSPGMEYLLLQALLGGSGSQKPSKREIFRDVTAAAVGANFLPSIGDIISYVTGTARGLPQGMGDRPPGSTTGKYLIDPSVIADYQQKYNEEMYNRAKLRAIPIIGERLVSQLADLKTPQEFLDSLRESAELQMESASERKKEERAQELANELAIAQLARESIVRQAELTGLANVQQERLKGSYGLAQGVLENAIENVLKSGTITDRSAEVELAQIK